jgi:hypothetical protein
MAKLFFSYSHVDEALRDRLEVHLSLLKHQGLIETWHDRRITAGSELDVAINENLESADVILLLVSADFIASKYCFSLEMKRALERHEEGTARVIPVILSSCDWHTAPFKKLLAAPKDGKAVTSWANQEEAWTDVARQVRSAVEELQTTSARRACPVREQDGAPPVPAVAAGAAHQHPRSSNLRLKKEFSDFDRDQFLHETFDFIAKFFAASLTELSSRNQGIRERFQQIDARRFTAVVYSSGSTVAECSVRIDSYGGRSGHLAFSYDASASSGSSNEMLNVEFDAQSMYMKALGMPSRSCQKESKLSAQGAAEYFWALFIERLQS